MAKNKKTAITPTRDEDFPLWYQNVVKAADMAENSPVRGCMIIKPNGYALWENIQRKFDVIIKDCDVQNAYFPLLIPLEYMNREAEHVDGFATECAVVTHHRLEKNTEGVLVPAGKLAEPYIVRPTSETIIGESMANWVQSYRDLPLKLNQWANVMRWEMRPRVFLRTSEFLWQEGHNCFATADDAREDALKMVNIYRDFAESELALPIIAGEKTADERFPGAVATYTIESMMQDGKALQAGTSHDLGQTFAKSFNISYQDKEGSEQICHTTSWGISTRLIGGMIMCHADDDGMVMPPRIAPHQVVIIPFTKGNDDDAKVMVYAQELKSKLRALGLRVLLNDKDDKPSNKLWSAIKSGVPLRVEVGSREVDEGTVTHTRRDLGRDSKTSCGVDELVSSVQDILETMQSDMLSVAKVRMDSHIFDVADLDELEAFYKAGKIGFVRMNASVFGEARYDEICSEYSLSSRCLPFADNGSKLLIGKSY